MSRNPTHKHKLDPRILTFCRKMSSERPFFVPHRPIPEKKMKECFSIVPEHVLAYGGIQRAGWKIHFWEKVWIEAELHCVWEDKLGRFVDLTPKLEKGNFIIFLPAPNIKYTGRQIDNIRKAVTSDPDVIMLIKLYADKFRYMNQGDLADQYGEISEIGGKGLVDVLSGIHDLMVKTERKIIGKYGRNPAWPY